MEGLLLTQLLILVNRLLLAHLEALGGLGGELVFVVVGGGHGGLWCYLYGVLRDFVGGKMRAEGGRVDNASSTTASTVLSCPVPAPRCTPWPQCRPSPLAAAAQNRARHAAMSRARRQPPPSSYIQDCYCCSGCPWLRAAGGAIVRQPGRAPFSRDLHRLRLRLLAHRRSPS